MNFRSYGLAAVAVFGFVAALIAVSAAEAAGGAVTDPKGTAPDRYVYYPGTEALKAEEIRVIACGTDRPGT